MNPEREPKYVWVVAGLLIVSALSTASAVPLFDPDEAYYPATASESVDSGAGWDLRYNNEPRWDKPILPYALIEESFALFGRSAAAARVPSALQGAALVIVVGLIVASMAGNRAGVTAAAVTATTAGIQIFSRAAHPEIGVVLGIATAQLLTALWLATDKASRRLWLAVLAGGAAGLGMTAKGPVALVLPLGTAIVAAVILRDRLPAGKFIARDLVLASTAAVAVAAPWYVLMTMRHGVDFLYEALWRQNVTRYTTDAFRHAGPPWFYVIPTLAGILPWSALLPGAIRRISLRDRSARGVLRLTMAIAAAVAFAFYSAASSKLPHYALVLIPPLAILIALHVDEVLHSEDGGPREFKAVAVVLFVVALGLVTAPMWVNHLISAREVFGGTPDNDPELPSLIGEAVLPAAAVLFATALLVWFRRSWSRVAVLVASGLIVPPVLLLFAAPLLNDLYPWEDFGARIRDTRGPIVLVGPRGPSLTFYSGRPVRRIEPSEATRALSQSESWLVADERWLREFMRTPLPEVDVQILGVHGRMALARVTHRRVRTR